MNEWYSPASRQKLIRRADAFAAARKNDPASIARCSPSSTNRPKAR